MLRNLFVGLFVGGIGLAAILALVGLVLQSLPLMMLALAAGIGVPALVFVLGWLCGITNEEEQDNCEPPKRQSREPSPSMYGEPQVRMWDHPSKDG